MVREIQRSVLPVIPSDIASGLPSIFGVKEPRNGVYSPDSYSTPQETAVLVLSRLYQSSRPTVGRSLGEIVEQDMRGRIISWHELMRGGFRQGVLRMPRYGLSR